MNRRRILLGMVAAALVALVGFRGVASEGKSKAASAASACVCGAACVCGETCGCVDG